eukprot:RCo012241
MRPEREKVWASSLHCCKWHSSTGISGWSPSDVRGCWMQTDVLKLFSPPSLGLWSCLRFLCIALGAGWFHPPSPSFSWFWFIVVIPVCFPQTTFPGSLHLPRNPETVVVVAR